MCPRARSLTRAEHAIIVKSRRSLDAISGNRGLRAFAKKDRFHVAAVRRFIGLAITRLALRRCRQIDISSSALGRGKSSFIRSDRRKSIL